MTIELLMNITPGETRVALVQNSDLQEIYIERNKNENILSSIFLGKVNRVLPGMQAAFIDIGMDKAAFLHVKDIKVRNTTTDINIVDLLNVGQNILVQVIKEPIGSKGARLTTDITLPSRYLVFLPDEEHTAISQRIKNKDERERLKKIASTHTDEIGSFIVRTAAEGISDEEISQDAVFLKHLWKKILEKKSNQKPKSQLYGEISLSSRIIRDFVGTEIDKVLVDSESEYYNLLNFSKELIPYLSDKVEFYNFSKPLFDLYDIENEIQSTLQSKVDLKSGGYIVIEQTEAMTTIDINTGAFVGKRNLEETIFNTNIESTKVIARQLKLRNLGGMILIDFIDMNDLKHRERVLDALKSELDKDKVKTNVYGFTQLGLVELTRKRTKDSLEKIMTEPCSTCLGRGYIKTVETVCYEIYREIIRVNNTFDADCFLIYVSKNVAIALRSEEFGILSQLEMVINKDIKIKTENLYGQEQFDVVLM
ncbi:ribonuclease E/G [Paraphotobacterium marinum]|uniref:Ribonuclease E/G n=1 Tax=Paraphotobacterium marinum TaxID=1755811 RepID=A0A220VCF3_9GAMM|nr:ribonuclease G [Paraphotobacterium marinum]ASK77961.1 ribonuclease E/G [Paraphotobacterium marinum]